MSLHHEARKDHERYARRRVGGAMKDDEAQDKKMIAKAVHEHEANDHPGKPKTKLRLKRGGNVKGKKPSMRLDKRARGGRMAHKHGKPSVAVVVNSGDTQMAHQMGMQQGAQLGAKAAAAKMAMAGRPPMPPGGPAANVAPPPPQGPRPMPNGPMPAGLKRGGAVMEAGSASGLGRLEKSKMHR